MTVSVQAHAGRVAFEIRDDGVGFDVDDVARGHGLTNLHDRDRGRCRRRCTSRPAMAPGTTVSGDVPTGSVTRFITRRG